MKKSFGTLGLSGLLALSLGAAPYVDFKETKKGEFKRQERNVYLNSGKVWLVQHTKDGKNAISKKWGDYFFGLQFGQAIHNGGWNKWNFFSCWQTGTNPVTKKWQAWDLTKNFVARGVTVNVVKGVAVADFVFPAVDDKGLLKIRLMQFPTHPQWTFMRVKAENFQPWRLDISASPCSAKYLAGEERYVGTKAGRHNLNIGRTVLGSSEIDLAFYKKFSNDTAGNFLLIEPDTFSKVLFWGGKGPTTTARMEVKRGVKEFHFALGYFWNQAAETAVNKFLTEDADAIRQFMKTINWEIKMSNDQVEKSIAEAAKLGVDQAKLAKFRTQYQKACQQNDTTQAAKILAEIEKEKKAKTASGLDQFR